MGPEQIVSSLYSRDNRTLEELCSTGKSNSLFFYTKDKKYMMKTIPKREFVKMRQVLKAYFEYMKNKQDSLIIRFYGLH